MLAMPWAGSHDQNMPGTPKVSAMPPRGSPPVFLPPKDDCITTAIIGYPWFFLVFGRGDQRRRSDMVECPRQALRVEPVSEKYQLSQADFRRCFPLRPHKGHMALPPRPDTKTEWRWYHQMAPPVADRWGYLRPDGNSPTGVSRGPFRYALLGPP